MKLRWFAIQLSPNERFEPMQKKEYVQSNTNSLEATFNWRCDSFIDFVTRNIRKLKIETDDYNMICIELCTNPKSNFKIFEKTLIVEIDAEESIYRKFTQSDEKGLNSFFVRKAKEGLNKLRNDKDISYDKVIGIINEFEGNDFLNIYTQQTKKMRNLNVEIKLVAQSTVQKFILRFQVFKDDNLIFSKNILETLPSPTFYYYEFKDIKVLKTTVQILKRNNELLTSIPIKEFEKFITK